MKRLFLLILPLMLVCNTNATTMSEELKRAPTVWFVMERQKDLDKQPNDSVSVTIQVKHVSGNTSSMWWPRPIIVITIRNRSERTIYVDKQNSFIIPNEELFPLYTNATSVSTKGSTAIGGVNLGVVGVGSANSEFNSTIKQEQRFVSIPAGTKTVLEVATAKPWGVPWTLNNNYGYISSGTDDRGIYVALIAHKSINKKQVLNFTEDNTPLNLDFRICYSFSEDMQPSLVNQTVYYTKHAIGSDKPVGTFTYKYDHDAVQKAFPSLDVCMSDPNMLVIEFLSTSLKIFE